MLIAGGILLLVGLQNLPVVWKTARALFYLVSPVLIGICAAFILNVPLRLIEEKLFAPLNRKNNALWNKLRRPVCLLLTLLLIGGLLFVVLFLLVPELKRTIDVLIDNFPQYLATLQGWLENLLSGLNLSPDLLGGFQIDWSAAGQMISDFLRNGSGGDILNTTMDITTSIVSGLFNFAMGLVFAIYMLLQKEKLCKQVRRTVYAFLPEKNADRLTEIGVLSNRIFSGFVSGQFTEAVIIGVLCYIGMKLFRMPYASMISVLVGFTALIPIFGAFIGTAVGAFLIVMVSPIQAVWFVIFIIVLQQLEGNLIYPHVVGTSVGLPSIWVMFAVLMGGATSGVVGMLVSVPVCSVLYCLLGQTVAQRLRKKALLGRWDKKTPVQDAPIQTDSP